MFSELEPADVQRLAAQRAVANAAALDFCATELVGTDRDLVILQQLIEGQHFGVDQTYELQCLGVALGDVLAFDGRFSWVVIDDEYGRDVTLRWKSTSLHVNALTMISKRIERGDAVDLVALKAWAFEHGEKADLREAN